MVKDHNTLKPFAASLSGQGTICFITCQREHAAEILHKETSSTRVQVSVVQVLCKRNQDHHPYKVIDVTPPSRNLGVRCFPSNMQCGECVTIEDKAYIVSAVTYRYQLRKGKYEPSEKRLDVQSTGRYLLNNYLEMLLEES
ncbi:uncharacterized protein LOC131075704 [Cryptomeria japonica]|uniref:uncharacterized protein LOC131075704 n=1 Tax=Cryptomeria japonica TaxID=3369 RepID=UPI0027DA7165|nr:uncharacterized protein LOC131075704 [Cryptomeria japonica]